jgi:hypothetical protein
MTFTRHLCGGFTRLRWTCPPLAEFAQKIASRTVQLEMANKNFCVDCAAMRC